MDLLANLRLWTGVGPVFSEFAVISAVAVVFYCQFKCS